MQRVRKLCFEGDSLIKKNTWPEILCTPAQVLTKRTQKNLSTVLQNPELQKLLIEIYAHQQPNLYFGQFCYLLPQLQTQPALRAEVAIY